jgi:hypothetical protein
VNELGRILLAIAVAFAGAAAGLMVGDAQTVVPPPEAVAEQFARHVAARRYDRALRHVDGQSGITLTTVRLSGVALHARAGAVDKVEGEPGVMTADRATAAAVLTTERAGRIRYEYSLVRRDGIWKISEWEQVP